MIAQSILCVQEDLVTMGSLKWIIIAAIVVLPVLASFAAVPASPAPQGVGEYFNGIIQYWKEVIAHINVPKSLSTESMSSA